MEPGEILLLFALALLAIGFIGWGIAWLFQNELPYVVLALVLAAIALIAWYRSSRSTSRVPAAASGSALADARAVRRRLSDISSGLERESALLASMRLVAHDEVNFALYRQRHYESLLLADRWYALKRSAVQTRGTLSGVLNRLREDKRQLARKRDRLPARSRAGTVRQLQATQSTIDDLYGALTALSAEIDRGSLRVKECNDRTAVLRDHIRDHCGAEGRRWYARLEARKRKKIGS
ncbi:hypothetical protein ACIQGZ_00320 [Streptomyces sp. NPDC092296]|uniref:hypothetical protein n=1 Tax=Streptomyces sp. NPDC092296 TaxID=3366012 RepID=UPI003821FABE